MWAWAWRCAAVPVTGRLLYVTAHPDDGRQRRPGGAYSRGRGLRVGLLTLTRGEGGQNALGAELFEALGLLRSEELQGRPPPRRQGAALHAGLRVRLLRSASTRPRAGLGDARKPWATWCARCARFRPDVILTLPLEARGEGRTTTWWRPASRARPSGPRPIPRASPSSCRAACAPGRRASSTRAGPAVALREAGASPVRVTTGGYDALLGRSYQQLGSLARAAHRSQSASQLEADPGPAEASLRPGRCRAGGERPRGRPARRPRPLVARAAALRPGRARERLALSQGLDALQSDAHEGLAAFDAGSDARALAALRRGSRRLVELEAVVRSAEGWTEATRWSWREHLAVPAEPVRGSPAARPCADAARHAADDLVVPGQSVMVRAEAFNAGQESVAVEELELLLPPGWSARRAEGGPGELPAGGALRTTFEVRVPDDARASRPYWHRAPGRDRVGLDVPADEGRPWDRGRWQRACASSSGEAQGTLLAPAMVRGERAAGGERDSELAVVPALAVERLAGAAGLPAGPASPGAGGAGARGEPAPRRGRGRVSADGAPGLVRRAGRDGGCASRPKGKSAWW